MIALGIVVGAVVAAAVALAPAGVDATALALLAAPVMVAGVRRRSRQVLLVGVAVLLGGIILASLRALDPGLLLVGTVGLVVAWDGASHLVDLRTQLDEQATVSRSVLAHSGATLAVTTLIATLVYAAFLLGTTVSPLAVTLFFVGAVLVVLGLGPRRR